MNLMERLDNLRSLIVTPEFLEGKGLSNEVNIRIFCYDPKDEMAVRCFTDKLVTDTSLACRIKEYNLYKVFLSICDRVKSLRHVRMNFLVFRHDLRLACLCHHRLPVKLFRNVFC